MNKVVEPLQRQRLLQVMKHFLFLKHQDMEESLKKKESISGNRIIDLNILSGIFGEIPLKK